MSPVLAVAYKLRDLEPGSFGEGVWETVWQWVHHQWEAVHEWYKNLPMWLWCIVIAWIVTFTVVSMLLWTCGFGPVGIGAGTLAAAFQSWAYGGFTPAGSLFAIFTSMGMLGTLNPIFGVLAAIIATYVAVFVWLCGIGR